MWSADQGVLDAAMLVTQGDFEVQHFLAVALKPKMAWLDDARVDRPDGNFVNLPAFDAEELWLSRVIAILRPYGL
jgi:hypothetical protein